MSDFNVDDILDKALGKTRVSQKLSLKEFFENRMKDAGVSFRGACDLLEVQYRTLIGVLEGDQKRADFSVLLKLATFLQLSKEEVVLLYLDSIEAKYEKTSIIDISTIEFIQSNFDLLAFKKKGLIKSINDYSEINEKLCRIYGVNNIRSLKLGNIKPAFSAGKIEPKNSKERDQWLLAGEKIFRDLSNPYVYNRQDLINYIPEIRWHSTKPNGGLQSVIKTLYKLGVSVIYLPATSGLHLRGATMSFNKKPCVILTDYKGFYATVWFALIHELFHVLFDWDEIMVSKYHISDSSDDDLALREKEKEANSFARKYLFSIDKTKSVKAFINNKSEISRIAKVNDIHENMIYVFDAFDSGNSNKYGWVRARNSNPDRDIWLASLSSNWDDIDSIEDYYHRNILIYN
ncbi:ImmA/IrrE family metallo-endopeptidase [Sphingobacterium corticibacter]|uniref:HTH cro/C1-type domain-containing protein n=1 Tax=Sphingobacterium corticibacter TaxID=2171749 RepID=A0A2T8HLF0_9SPHI|nr:hypothetical protein [Sphingobacterium corticibacter]PVH26274.1 hypothetical protein DC487_01215 [Sphingobacterium corticibacter]